MLHPVPTDPEQNFDSGEARAHRQASPVTAPNIDPTWRAGRKLSEARKQLGWSLEEVADRIRVRREFLAALEDMNVKLLPGKAYALAFLRSYARELGIDEKAIVDQFQDESALTREDAQKQIRGPSSRPHARRPWLAAAVLVAAAAGFVSWRALTHDNEDQVAEQGTASAPAVLGSTPVGGETEELRVVEIRALSEAWLSARGPDGTVFLDRVLQPGDVYRPDPSPGWTLHARDGGAFELFVNGVPAGPLGAATMPVLGRPIDGIQPLTQAELPSPRS